ncbi:hypothetical protein FIA58_014665 [Flavobacterium jejuense]|uniref:Tetratricopeptide repeat protein n=1 Tax=Flavobacterium jejuense TaxID=1544455 RepID=A0ABX0ISV0_9FLAO|nr:hypothetical protein [Flavobacterium jejuense]NHN26924.1 hypothetical protein [Flavobacterium jejuense]
MKKWQLFILFLITNISTSVLGCGYYPYGEDIRFCFSRPEHFNMYGFSEFNYSSDLFYPNEDKYKSLEENPNIVFWHNYCKGKISYNAVSECVYSIPYESFNEKVHNNMVTYLFAKNDMEAIDYLKFAKKCEVFNVLYSDPWERNDSYSIPQRGKLIQAAEKLAEVVKNPELKRRYAFLAIRLAYYNNQLKDVSRLFDATFATEKQKDIVYYWSLYFKAIVEKDKALQSFYAAQVFIHAPDKRFAVFYNFSNEVSISEILTHAKTKEEKANVYALASIRRHDKALEYIKKVYELDPKNEALPFLLLREVNKIEDWVFTPYYSLFDPSVTTLSDEEKYSYEFSYSKIQARIVNDRKYAAQVLAFAKAVKTNKIEHALEWNVLKIQLLFVTEDYATCLKEIAAIKNQAFTSTPLNNQLEITEVLCRTANQTQGAFVILPETQENILKHKNNAQFVFALGRILEYNGNKTDAAFLYSTINHEMTWKSKRNKSRSYRDYFYDYFQYINVMSTVEEVKSLIADVESHTKLIDDFSTWKYKTCRGELQKLYDLVGTQYIRKNDLKTALRYFEKIDNDYWNESDYLWKRANMDDGFDDENPFFTLKYTPDFIEKKEKFILNKKTITAKLIEYIDKTENGTEKDYYSFLVANCYYNMTIHGNAWMMRRFGVSANDVEPYPEDEAEFQNGFLAKKYYEKAMQNAKTDKFKALCLRMIGRCDSFQIRYKNPNSSYEDYNTYNDSIFKLNTTYAKLKKEYPDDYDNLIYGCTAFEDYFNARK